ncbi:MAG: serpin family protein [candidate division KSB1 bacterium]|nr:serpin family protein [candidate division KSB1 bacterium]MDZ7304699.1 serpin family protein [candidate division KSB1 bacterium]MDZ7311685.1 serpin family protein [candidate division KSB1 bacterium]
MSRRLLFILLVGAALTSSHAQQLGTKMGSTKPNLDFQQATVTIDRRLVSANTTFGFKLFDKLIEYDSGKNIFISPSSVAFALAMIYNGASGETRQAMAKTLEWPAMSLQEINQANNMLQSLLTNPDPQVQLAIANSLWARKGIMFKPEFLKSNQDFYAAEVSDLNFATPGATATINDWVNRKTNRKINKIVDRINSDAVLFLINAIYFKGKWSVPFDRARTKDGMFTLLHGGKKKHPMMSQSGRYKYLQSNGFQAISLPYGAERMSMYIFLPDGKSDLKTFSASLNAENWEGWMSQFRSVPGEIVLPRFKVEYEVVLNAALKTLGMEVAFDPRQADFNEMYSASPNMNVYVGEVKHKTFVEVNEEGTEAAAVTSGQMLATSYTPPFKMIVDRPFFCAIRDNTTGTVLFMGAIVEPK